MAREILGVAGAVIGFVIGGPIGAQIGYTIGSGIGGELDPFSVAGPKLGEAPIQTSREGIPIPIGWGIVHCHGNIIQADASYFVTTTESSGSLWSKTETSTTRRYKTFAIGVCRSAVGQISGIRRIWENDRLVYDTRDVPAISAEEQAAYAAKITIYLGSESQLPDADLEAITGVGNQPAYRGLAYIVWPDYDITDFGSVIPQYRFEVLTGADLTVTSKPYPIEVIEGLSTTYAPDDAIYQEIQLEGLSVTLTPDNGELNNIYNQYEVPAEGLQAALLPDDGTLRDIYNTYSVPAEGLTVTLTPDDGTLRDVIITYSMLPEGLQATLTPQNGTLA